MPTDRTDGEPDRASRASQALAAARAAAQPKSGNSERGRSPDSPAGGRPLSGGPGGRPPGPALPGDPGGRPPGPALPGDPGGRPPGPALPGGRQRERRDDPASLDAAIGGLVVENGWELPLTTASVLARWAQIVGPEVAAHATPGGLADGELEVLADSTAWATQLRLLAAELIRRLNAELGPGAVRRVRVRGPGTHPAPAGRLRVRGGRGPRDTYG